MGRYSSDKGGGSFTPAPVGTHVARCYRIVDIGTQHGEWNGEEKVRNQIILFWELPNEFFEYDHDGVHEKKPFTVSKFYTNSLHEKASLRADLESWRGRAFTPEELKGFDLENVLGKPCMVTVISGKDNKVKVSNVTGLPKGLECPPQFNESDAFWMGDEERFEKLSDGLKALVRKSDEYRGIGANQVPDSANEPIDDGMPF